MNTYEGLLAVWRQDIKCIFAIIFVEQWLFTLYNHIENNFTHTLLFTVWKCLLFTLNPVLYHKILAIFYLFCLCSSIYYTYNIFCNSKLNGWRMKMGDFLFWWKENVHWSWNNFCSSHCTYVFYDIGDYSRCRESRKTKNSFSRFRIILT